ncbi:hypothetical protein MICA_305 [Micavibrio aeruginosavorus ARL-13]|uniref:Uncharacterized protein n=1 Tax=Micavibrio aeruginosavorus (strain ARL-13) TaxID=856793 RepID=G2KQA8_MICAA|nr:hypothetical protein MICA_305 [Micavibrio aeruginosavorus ARL-13]
MLYPTGSTANQKMKPTRTGSSKMQNRDEFISDLITYLKTSTLTLNSMK